MSIFGVATRNWSSGQARPAPTRRPWFPAIAVSLAVVATLCGCAGAPKPAQIDATIQASAGVNPSPSKRPSPLLVRIYELKSAAAFNASDFVSLYQRDQAELAGDLVGRDEFMLAPGESRSFAKTLGLETRYIGVIAAYRDLERSQWRSVVTIEPGKKQQLLIRADALAISATVQK